MFTKQYGDFRSLHNIWRFGGRKRAESAEPHWYITRETMTASEKATTSAVFDLNVPNECREVYFIALANGAYGEASGEGGDHVAGGITASVEGDSVQGEFLGVADGNHTSPISLYSYMIAFKFPPPKTGQIRITSPFKVDKFQGVFIYSRRNVYTSANTFGVFRNGSGVTQSNALTTDTEGQSLFSFFSTSYQDRAQEDSINLVAPVVDHYGRELVLEQNDTFAMETFLGIGWVPQLGLVERTWSVDYSPGANPIILRLDLAMGEAKPPSAVPADAIITADGEAIDLHDASGEYETAY